MFGIIGGIAFLIVVILLAVLVFEVYMFIDAATNKHISRNTRIFWLVGMILLHPIIAIIYYFTDYQKNDR